MAALRAAATRPLQIESSGSEICPSDYQQFRCRSEVDKAETMIEASLRLVRKRADCSNILSPRPACRCHPIQVPAFSELVVAHLHGPCNSAEVSVPDVRAPGSVMSYECFTGFIEQAAVLLSMLTLLI